MDSGIKTPETTTAPLIALEGPAEDELAIAYDRSDFDLYRLYVIRPQAPVNKEHWIKQVEDDFARQGRSVEWVAVFEYKESLAGFWHLRLYWKETVISRSVGQEAI
jgi:hypothetical protein